MSEKRIPTVNQGGSSDLLLPSGPLSRQPTEPVYPLLERPPPASPPVSFAAPSHPPQPVGDQIPPTQPANSYLLRCCKCHSLLSCDVNGPRTVLCTVCKQFNTVPGDTTPASGLASSQQGMVNDVVAMGYSRERVEAAIRAIPPAALGINALVDWLEGGGSSSLSGGPPAPPAPPGPPAPPLLLKCPQCSKVFSCPLGAQVVRCPYCSTVMMAPSPPQNAMATPSPADNFGSLTPLICSMCGKTCGYPPGAQRVQCPFCSSISNIRGAQSVPTIPSSSQDTTTTNTLPSPPNQGNDSGEEETTKGEEEEKEQGEQEEEALIRYPKP